jgi:hypothetical protein
MDALSPADVEILRALGIERSYKADVVIFHQGDEPSSVLVWTSPGFVDT